MRIFGDGTESSLHRKNRRGMTLVELAISVALSAMLLSTLVGVLSGISRQEKASRRFDRPIWHGRAMEIIRRDLLSADSLWKTGGTIWIKTSPPAYGRSNRGLRTIGYRCICISDTRTALTRLDADTEDVLGFGASSIAIERLDASGVPQPIPGIEGPVPNQVRVWISGDQAAIDPYVADLIIR